MAIVSALSSVVNIPENLIGHAIVVLITIIISSTFLLWGKSEGDGQHVSEPPIAQTSIPTLGHVFGMWKHQNRYLEVLRQKTLGPAYTIKFLSSRTYVIVSPSLCQIALKNKALSLEPLMVRLGGAMLGISKEATQKLGLGENGHWIGSPAMGERRVDLNNKLAPGASLSLVTKTAGQEFANIVNEFKNDWVEKDLYMWLRDNVTYVTLLALYGPSCPMALDRSLIDDLWIFDENQLWLSISKYPLLTARQGLKARKRLSDGFEHYLRSNGQQYASSAVQSSIDLADKNNLSLEDKARLEVFNTSVATVNTAPTAIWMIINILSNKTLLGDLREEMASVMKITTTSQGRNIHLDFTNINESCPLLHATYQESLRLGSIPTSNRIVLEDTVVTDPGSGREFSLKKGNRVVVPIWMLHTSDTNWTGNTREFNPWRFLKTTTKENKEKRTVFVPYGGGIHLCPGRHLAQVEVLAVAGLMMAALDFELSDGSKVTVPLEVTENGSKKPAVPMIVRIRKRTGWEDVTWSVQS